MENWFIVLASGITGVITAIGTAIPLIAKIKRMHAVAVTAKQRQENTQKISVEGEWKRILEERAKEEARLRLRDEEQDRRLDDMLTRFIQSERNYAAAEERVKILQSHVDQLTALLMQRCPTCPSRPNLTLPLSSSSLPSPPEPIVTRVAQSSPSTKSPASLSDGSSELPAI